ncbi:VOC family protein [Leucobacter sp. CSA2]|uniref:VOC family protein n=1 Tax=Leucobacter edaphi TaxID=2796472 RepID=A0A934UWT2_9MICO|nr:VOC family protein [Leucobacter edaphi]MBK0421295.1 VOC family protein [Leucobacter edaphi]
MIGKLSAVVLDCRDPQHLAEFYRVILGGTIDKDPDGDWIDLKIDGGGPLVSFQQVPGHEPPEWPGDSGDQQLHLDIAVEDFDHAEQALLEAGARFVESHDGFRVFLDPAGHPFCIVH